MYSTAVKKNMPQFTWTYVGGGGNNHTVSLFHGEKTGHVLLMLNGKIMQIDFGVRDSKTYPFFIEEEFCEVRLEQKGEQMYYYFEINKKVDTPFNRARKKRERRNMGQTLVFFSFLILLAVGFVFGFQAYDRKLKSKNWSDEAFSGSTTGRVYFDGNAVAYAYIVGNRGYSRHFFPDKATGDLLPEMPLEEGDEFTVRFHPDRPNFSRILFSQPTEAQQEKYIERIMAVHLPLHPAEHPLQVRCALQLAAELHGTSAFADFFYQATPPAERVDHNRDSYYRLVRDPVFQKKLTTRCWN